MGQRPPVPDFLAPQRPTPWLGWALLLVALPVAGIAGWEFQALRSQRAEVAEHLQRIERAARVAPRLVAARAPAQTEAESLAPEARSALGAAARRLAFDWGQVLQAVERSSVPGVAWLALDIDGERERVRLEAQAVDLDAAWAVVDALAVRERWSEAVMTRQQANDARLGEPGLRFELTARVDAIDAGAVAAARATRAAPTAAAGSPSRDPLAP